RRGRGFRCMASAKKEGPHPEEPAKQASRRMATGLRPSFETPTFRRLLRVCERFSPYEAATPRLQLVISCRQNTTIMVVLFSIECPYACVEVRNQSANGKYFMSQLDENFKKFPVIFPVIREFGPGLFS